MARSLVGLKYPAFTRGIMSSSLIGPTTVTHSSMVRVSALYAPGYRFESGWVNTKDDLAQLVEQYSDTIQVDSSSLSVITNWSVA